MKKQVSRKPSEEGDFSVQNLGLFFQSQCLLTQLPAEAVAMSRGNVKQEIITRN